MLATRGGCWFSGEGIDLHLGVEADIGVERCYTADPFGNRIELIAAVDRGFSSGRDRG